MANKKVHIDGQVWDYSIGKSNVVITNPLTKKKLVVQIPTVKNCLWSTFERGQWKKTSDGTLNPSEVKTYIETEILKRTQP